MNSVQSTGHTGSMSKKDSQIEVNIFLSFFYFIKNLLKMQFWQI